MTHCNLRISGILTSLLIVISGCGDNIKPLLPDAAPEIPDAEPPFMSCGDGLVTGNEECDDSNSSDDDECLSDCTLACGDGDVNSAETCDTAIAAGQPGACPTDCDDGMPCTVDVLSGDECRTECLFTQITANMDNDGCCLPGADANVDNDCTSICGNSVVEPGEVCDSGIAAGQPGACPTDCNDNASCTADFLDNPNTCLAACRNVDITTPMNGDGCCPPGADIGNDDDCSALCGDGIWSPADGETCDTAIPAGAGSCPAAADCVDGMACTTDVLTGSGTCTAICVNSPITTPDNTTSDGCCPPTGNANNDVDCTPTCGNGALESGEDCDDGGVTNGDGCSATCMLEPTAFRIDSLELRDPHPFALILGFVCTDINDDLNTEVDTALTGDADGNGFLDFSVVNVFRPLDQASASTPVEIVFGNCTTPPGSTSCSQPASPAPIPSTATNMSTGICLQPVAGTVRPYAPAVANSIGPCYASDPEDLVLDLSGILIPLTDARIGGTYVGSPATNVVNGLLMGFISETDAENTILPASIPVVGGQSLASLLPGGTGNCNGGDDRDVGPDGMTTGWWLYLNFTGTRVPWTSP